MKRAITIAAVIIIPLIGIILLANKAPEVKTATNKAVASSSNVKVENGKQIIEITAKGGYSPRSTTAKADMPTIIRVKTNGSFDCSTSLRIPDLKYFKNLPPTGTTDIEVTAQSANSTLRGLCSMGMYNFSIQFKG